MFILINPVEEVFKIKNAFDNENFTIFLGVVTIICCGIEALGGFYKGEAKGEHFKDFVIDYMHPAYKKDRNKLVALRDNFRNGLAHGFCIKRGGFSWGKKYFTEHKALGLLISIDELFEDFKKAFLKYINDLENENKNSEMVKNFKKRFKGVFILGK